MLAKTFLHKPLLEMLLFAPHNLLVMGQHLLSILDRIAMYSVTC